MLTHFLLSESGGISRSIQQQHTFTVLCLQSVRAAESLQLHPVVSTVGL